jgi:hypothetical protein
MKAKRAVGRIKALPRRILYRLRPSIERAAQERAARTHRQRIAQATKWTDGPAPVTIRPQNH